MSAEYHDSFYYSLRHLFSNFVLPIKVFSEKSVYFQFCVSFKYLNENVQFKQTDRQIYLFDQKGKNTMI